MKLGRLAWLSVAALALVLTAPAAAYAWAEYDATWEGDVYDCEACHTEPFPFSSDHGGSGPHMGYASTTSKCRACHSVHEAPEGGILLLRHETIRDNCLVCHDGSGGSGVYGTLAARGVTVGGGHSIDATNVIPGGDAAGGPRSEVFGGVGNTLSCNDCHSPHGANVVEAFRGERVRFHVMEVEEYRPTMTSTRLLKRKPTGAEAEVAKYGSDWCAGCHRGRPSGSPMVNNHPVDSLLTTATPFDYGRVAIVTSDTSLETTYGPLGYLGTGGVDGTWHNRGFVMPDPRTSRQSGHAPICQQCHEDSREVGSVGAVAPAFVTRYGDGLEDPFDNPRFQCFPHETENVRMLVETADDLCTNCHGAGLP